MKGCTCEFKRQMMAQMLELRRNPLDGKRNWASLLFENDPDESLCCLLTFLFYCAYCKPCILIQPVIMMVCQLCFGIAGVQLPFTPVGWADAFDVIGG